MLLLRLLEFSFVVLFLTLLITQVIVPAVKGTRLFPLLDPRRREVTREMTEAREEREVEEAEKTVDETRDSIGEKQE